MHEVMEHMGRHFHVQIFGTDLDEDAISVARAGLYPGSIQADVERERLNRFFSKEEDGRYRVNKQIRETLVFAPQNVIKDPPFTRLDLLSCRNLMIYLGAELQHRLLPIFHYSLKPGGVLFLGGSETVGQATDLFKLTHKKWKIYQRRRSADAARPVLDFATRPAPYDARDLQVPETVRKAEALSAIQLVESILQQSDTPPCAIVNDAGDVVYIHGRTGRYLEPAEGKASVNIVDMARPGLKKPLADAIRHVTAHKQESLKRGVPTDFYGKKLLINLTVKPILEQIAMRGLMMVTFEETTALDNGEDEQAWPAKQSGKSAEELVQELRNTREDLQTTIEELETSNEELKSTNEELQSTNEELQSTNEELETSKEELQSLNEESVTVNTELQARIDELSRTTDDLRNLLDSTEIAVIFLDAKLCIRRFTPRATEIIPLTASDAGHPIKDLASQLIGLDLAEYGELVLKDLAVREVEAQSQNGDSYILRVRPYRTTSNVIDGVVITIEDVTARKSLEVARKDSERIQRLALQAVGAGAADVDLTTGDGVWTPELARIWGLPEELGQPFAAYCREHVHANDRLRVEQEFEVIRTSGVVGEMEFRIIRPDGTSRWIRWRGFVGKKPTGENQRALLVNFDITEEKAAADTGRGGES